MSATLLGASCPLLSRLKAYRAESYPIAEVAAPSSGAENTTGATALYERVGMRIINRWDLWER